MRSNERAFLVDTNVLVYVYDRSDDAKRQRAIALVDRLAADRSGALSPQILGEFFTTVTRKIPSPLTAGEAERSLTHYARSWRIYDLTAGMVLEAARGVQRFQLSYWDSLIWATAKLSAVPNVLSEDFSDRRLIEGVRFLNPFVPAFDLGLLTTS